MFPSSTVSNRNASTEAIHESQHIDTDTPVTLPAPATAPAGTAPAPGAADPARHAARGRGQLDRTSEIALTPHPDLVELPGAEVPATIKTAELQLRRAIRDLNQAAGQPPAQLQAAREAYQEAQGSYLNEVSGHLRGLSLAPQAPVNPSNRQAMANMLGAVVSNLAGFTIPAALTAVAATQTQDTRIQNAVYALSTAVGNSVGSQLGPYVTRLAGGTTNQLRLSGQNSANTGSYKAIGGDALMTLYNLAIYAGASAGLANVAFLVDNPAGKVIKAGASGIAMSVLGQYGLKVAADATLKRNDVARVEDLPETAHNRSMKNGVFQNKLPRQDERTSQPNKNMELMVAALGDVIGAAAVYADRQGLSTRADHPSAKASADILGIGMFLGAGQLAKTAFTWLNNDPARNPNKFGIAASQVATEKIHASALNRFENVLDEVGVAIEHGGQGAPAAARFDAAVKVLGGAVYREAQGQPDADMPKALAKANALAGEFHQLAADLRAPRAEGQAELITDATVAKIARSLETAGRSLDIASASAAKSGEIQPEVKDALNRIRDVQALLLQSQFQLGGNGQLDRDPRIWQITAQLLPTFAALRKADRMDGALGLMKNVEQFGQRDGAAASGYLGQMAQGLSRAVWGDPELAAARLAVAALDGKAHGRVLAGDVASLLARSGDGQRMLDTLPGLFAAAYAGKPPSTLDSKLLILNNMINTAARPPAELAAADGNVRHRLLDSFGPGRGGLAQTLVDDFKNGAFSAAALQRGVAELADLAASVEGVPAPRAGAAHDEEAASATLHAEGRAAAHALGALTKALGPQFLAALKQEQQPGGDDGVDAAAGTMLQAIWHDVERDMPEMHRGLLAASLSLPLRDGPADIATHRQHDAHFHPTSYSNNINSLSQLLLFMDRNGIDKTNLAGIPSQVRKMTAAAKYYANSSEKISYRSHDHELAGMYKRLDPSEQARFDVSMTAIDPTDESTIEKDMDMRLREHPGVFMAVGETTLLKEIISDKNPNRPEVASKATQTLLNGAAARGLPLILHCDRGQPGDKDRNAKAVLGEIKKWAKGAWNATDPLQKDGAKDVPPIKPRVVWAHGAGISRFTAESATHTVQLDEMLSDPDLKDILNLDLSWDFVGHDIMENMHDQLKKAGLTPELRTGMQNLLKLYKTFTEEGNAADKADDLGDLNLASVHRVGAEAAAEKYFDALGDFKVRVGKAFENPVNVEAFTRLMEQPGTDGNNWFHLLNKHQDRMLFGTDALSVGTKAHGDASYAMNTRVLSPIYEIFDQLGAQKPQFKDISSKLCTENYDKVFHDPEIDQRRHAWEDMLRTERPAEHSTNARPVEHAATDGVVSALASGHAGVGADLKIQEGLRHRSGLAQAAS